jgi:molybdopterin synthase catalytic subunit
MPHGAPTVAELKVELVEALGACRHVEGDELAVFPPVSGGSKVAQTSAWESFSDFFELTTDPIDVGTVARRVVLPQCGATVTLDGYAREWTKGRRTLYLVYEAYESMALSELKRLGAQAHEKFDIAHIGIVHRTGRLDIGETSVVISVSAPARPTYLPIMNWKRPTGLAITASAVPVRISCATEADAAITDPNNPVRNVTASTLSFTIFGSSPKPK